MSQKLKILITNDDGIHAKGLKALWQAVKDFAEVTIIAPTSEKSGSGLAHSLNKPLKIHSVRWEEKETSAWAINGTPADCMKLGFNQILKQKPDLILSGINRGSNAGRSVLYSGTVGGVIEGVHKQVPGIAFSCHDFENPNYEAAKKYIPFIVKYFTTHAIPRGSLINVNFPHSDKEITGVQVARQGLGFWSENPDSRKHPSGHHTYYWLGGKWIECDEHQDSDVALLEKGYITVVPIYVEDLTHNEMFKEHKSSFEKSFNEEFF